MPLSRSNTIVVTYASRRLSRHLVVLQCPVAMRSITTFAKLFFIYDVGVNVQNKELDAVMETTCICSIRVISYAMERDTYTVRALVVLSVV